MVFSFLPKSRREILWLLGRLLLALGVFGGLFVVAILLSQWGTWQHTEPSPPSTSGRDSRTHDAAMAIAAGELLHARRQVEAVLAVEPLHAPTLLLQACLALESGERSEVEMALARLQSAAPGQLEPVLLEEMWKSLTQDPSHGWRSAFLRAWVELGRPSFASSPLLPEIAMDEVQPTALTQMPERMADAPPVQLMLVLATPRLSEERARWLMEQLPMLEDPTLAQVAAVALLAARLPPALQDQAQAAARSRLSRLVQASPGVMHPRMLLLWAENPEWTALSHQELEGLEALTALPTWNDSSFGDTLMEARALLTEAGLANPDAGAFKVALMSRGNWALVLLLKRAEETRRQLLPGSRQRLGRILWKIGSLLETDSTVLTRMVGLQLMLDGATDLGDEAEHERVKALIGEARTLLTAANHAALESWPLPSLWAEVAHARAQDEWAHVREVAGAPTAR